MRVAPPAPRSTIVETSEGLQISIPARRHVFLMLFLPVWLVGWTFGEVLAARALIPLWRTENSGVMFLGAWLVAWTLGGGLALVSLLWMFAGREVIGLRPNLLQTRNDLWGFGRSKEYDLGHVRNLRVASQSWNPYDWRGGWLDPRIQSGSIAFDYGSQTIRIGSGIDEAEARAIVNQLKSRHAFSDTAA